MATQGAAKQARQTNQKPNGQKQTGRSTRSGNFPLDDLSYNMVTVLYEKSKALEAFDKYAKDAQDDEAATELFEQMRQSDEQFVEQLRDLLGQRLSTD